jgi:hypothetical protein
MMMHLPLLVLLLVGGRHHATATATAEGNDESDIIIISTFAKLPHKSFYSLQYSVEGCNNSTASASWVNLDGFLSGMNSTSYHSASSNNPNNVTCAEAAVCASLFDPTHLCPDMGTFVGEVSEETGDVMLDYMQFTDDYTHCSISGWYNNCYYEYESLDALTSNPDLLANSNPADLEAMKDFIYYVYYEDDICTEPASIWSSVDGEVVTVDIVSNYTEYSCAVRSACALDPNASICKAVRDGPGHNATFVSITEPDKSTGEQAVYVCDTSNAEVAQDECSVISPRDCIASSHIHGCHLRFFSGPTLAKYPRVLIGDMTGLPTADSDVSNRFDQESSASKAFSLVCHVLSLVGIISAITA